MRACRYRKKSRVIFEKKQEKKSTPIRVRKRLVIIPIRVRRKSHESAAEKSAERAGQDSKVGKGKDGNGG
jgi:hypothetical protein